MAHADTVRQIYEAFGRSDIAAILNSLADDVEWEYGINSTDVPWLQPRHGRAEVAAFFQSLAELEIRKFQPKRFLEAADLVVAVIDFEARVRKTGQQIVEDDEVHLWYFNSAGKVSRFRHRIDTHQHWLAAGDR